MQPNPFDDDSGSFFVLVNDEEQHSLWPAFVDTWRAGGWFTGRRRALSVWTMLNGIGPIYGRSVCVRSGSRPRRLKYKRALLGGQLGGEHFDGVGGEHFDGAC